MGNAASSAALCQPLAPPGARRGNGGSAALLGPLTPQPSLGRAFASHDGVVDAPSGDGEAATPAAPLPAAAAARRLPDGRRRLLPSGGATGGAGGGRARAAASLAAAARAAAAAAARRPLACEDEAGPDGEAGEEPDHLELLAQVRQTSRRGRSGSRLVRARTRRPAHTAHVGTAPRRALAPCHPALTPCPCHESPQLHDFQHQVVAASDNPLLGLSDGIELLAAHLMADLAA
jgi:hypothetical protein